MTRWSRVKSATFPVEGCTVNRDLLVDGAARLGTMRRLAGALTVTAMALFALLDAGAANASPFDVQVVNDSGQPAQNVYLELQNTSSTDGQLANETPRPLSQIRNSTFSLGEFGAGRLYVSFGAPVKTNEENHAPTRYDKIEFTNPGVANLTAVDFFSIPFDLQALDDSGAQLGEALTYRCYTATVLKALRALAPSAEVDSGGQFVRFLSPQLSPASYPSMAPYVHSMVGQTIEVADTFGSATVPTKTITYTGTFQPDGSITLEGTFKPASGPATTGMPLHIPGATLPEAIYTGNGAFTVGGNPADVSENNEYSVIYRDVVAGFALGYWGGKYGNSTADWLRKPDFAAARASSTPYAAWDEYASAIGEYSAAYGYSFHDLGPTAVTVPLNSSVTTLRLTIDPDEGPDTPGCVGNSTAAAPRPPLTGSVYAGGPVTKPGQVRVAILSSMATLEKRGRALIALSCGGDPCRGQLSLNQVVKFTQPPRRGTGARGRALLAKRQRGKPQTQKKPVVKTRLVVLGASEFSIDEGKSQRIWVTVSAAGRRTIQGAKGHLLSALARASVGPRNNPTIAGQRYVRLRSYTPARRRALRAGNRVRVT